MDVEEAGGALCEAVAETDEVRDEDIDGVCQGWMVSRALKNNFSRLTNVTNGPDEGDSLHLERSSDRSLGHVGDVSRHGTDTGTSSNENSRVVVIKRGGVAVGSFDDELDAEVERLSATKREEAAAKNSRFDRVS